jgi:hypothetical protein
MAGGIVSKLFFHNRDFEYPVYRIRLHSGVYHAVRAAGDIRDLDSDQEVLEDVAVLIYVSEFRGQMSDDRRQTVKTGR